MIGLYRRIRSKYGPEKAAKTLPATFAASWQIMLKFQVKVALRTYHKILKPSILETTALLGANYSSTATAEQS
jgi:hypothetical protein